MAPVRTMAPLLAFIVACGNTVIVEQLAPDATGSSGSGSSTSTAAGGPPPINLCDLGCESPTEEGTVQSPLVTEASGLIASKLFDGVYYVHNDSGDAARFFAMDLSGADLGEFTMKGATSVDWEDAAAGPCKNGGSCLYFGDIGDNDEVRPKYSFYRVPEPSKVGAGAVETLEAERFTFVYEDGPHDVEAMLIDPDGPRVLMVVKEAIDGAVVFGSPVPLSTEGTMTFTRVADFDIPTGLKLVTAAETFDEHGVLLRTYSRVFFYPRPPGGSVLDALGATGCPLPTPVELQGETVAPLRIDDTSAGYVTVQEGGGVPVNVVRCRP